jgi:drug/metabolite transporter (DMT)-like permease
MHMKNIRNDQKEIILLPLAILAISTASIFIRYAQETLPSLTIAAYRLAFASVFMLPFSLRVTFRVLRERNVKELGLLFFSGVLLAMHFAAWIVSLSLTKVINSVVLVITTPIWVALLSPLLTKDSIPKKFWFGLLTAFVGMLVVSGIGRGNDGYGMTAEAQKVFIGNSLALIGAFCAAGYVLIGRILRDKISNQAYTFSVYSVAAIVLVGFAGASAPGSLRVDPAGLKWVILLALIPQIAGHSLINWFLGFRPAHEVSLALLGEPIGSTLLAIIFLGEMPAPLDIIGALIILAGILIAQSKSSRPTETVN